MCLYVQYFGAPDLIAVSQQHGGLGGRRLAGSRPAVGVGVAERDVRDEAAGPLASHDLPGVLSGRSVHRYWRRRRQGIY